MYPLKQDPVANRRPNRRLRLEKQEAGGWVKKVFPLKDLLESCSH